MSINCDSAEPMCRCTWSVHSVQDERQTFTSRAVIETESLLLAEISESLNQIIAKFCDVMKTEFHCLEGVYFLIFPCGMTVDEETGVTIHSPRWRL